MSAMESGKRPISRKLRSKLLGVGIPCLLLALPVALILQFFSGGPAGTSQSYAYRRHQEERHGSGYRPSQRAKD